MGQHLASFREFLRMDGENENANFYAEGQQRQSQSQRQMEDLSNFEIRDDNDTRSSTIKASKLMTDEEIVDAGEEEAEEEEERNGNDRSLNPIAPEEENTESNAEEVAAVDVDDKNNGKSNGNSVIEAPSLDNEKNSRFESIYSQPIESQDIKNHGNGNYSGKEQREVASSSNNSITSSSNSSSSSEDNNSSSSTSSASSSSATPVNPPVRRTSKTLSFGKQQKSAKQQRINKETSAPATGHPVLATKKKRSNWVLKFNCAKSKSPKNNDIPEQPNNSGECVCTGYRRTDEHPMGAGIVFNNRPYTPQSPVLGPLPPSPVIDLSRFNPAEFPMEDCDARARLQRAREMEEGVEPPPGYRPNYPSGIQVHPNGITVDSLTALFQAHAGIHAAALTALSQIDFTLVPSIERPAHTQVDYVHCLVPDLRSITACSFYWGKMDRYEAERLLEGKPEGTFLLRDSAQEEFLFSVSFRKYDRSLHARIEQWNHKFSFDAHDPGVYASETVCGLIEHYKDPSCCMFFEPMLTIPLHRHFAFPLQHLCRAVITTRTTYDGINKLQLPKTLKSYLKEYHYKQRVRVRRLDTENNVVLDSRSISYIPFM